MNVNGTKQNRRIIPLAQPANCCTITPALAPSEIEDIASEVKLLSALADNTRLQIVQMLSRVEEPLCVCDILTHFTLGQPTISHHLKVLRDARLVSWEKRGLWVHYSLNRETLAQASDYLAGVAVSPATAGSLALW